MNALWSLINLLVFIQIVICRDFYIGMFRKNDFLVAQDVIYKELDPFGYTTASYGRLFKCPITYFRVVDRLGMGRGPITTITRGGLRKKYITVRIKSTTYGRPVSVNIYVGCENKNPSTHRTSLATRNSSDSSEETTSSDGGKNSTTTTAANGTEETTAESNTGETASEEATPEEETTATPD